MCITIEHSVIWVTTYIYSSFNQKKKKKKKKKKRERERGFFKVKTISGDFFVCLAVDLLIPILQCANAHMSNVLRFEKILFLSLAFLHLKSLRLSMWCILQYSLLFSIYFDHNIQHQPKTTVYLTLYSL